MESKIGESWSLPYGAVLPDSEVKQQGVDDESCLLGERESGMWKLLKMWSQGRIRSVRVADDHSLVEKMARRRIALHLSYGVLLQLLPDHLTQPVLLHGGRIAVLRQ